VRSFLSKACQLGALATVLAGVSACNSAEEGVAPRIDAVAAGQVAVVGEPFVLELRASDADHDVLDWSLGETTPPGVSVRPYGDGANAVLAWTPSAGDLGSWAVDVAVSDGVHVAVETVAIEVAASGQGTPVFRAPLASGVSVDRARAACVDVDVVVEDADSEAVTIDVATEVTGATFTSTGAFAATWHFCPEVDAGFFPLTFVADDGANVAMKDYLVIVMCSLEAGCAPRP
jgi:hypothetical protein